jgi:hypothetical protein
MLKGFKYHRPPVEQLVKLCNCAGCGGALLGESMRDVRTRLLGDYTQFPLVAKRIDGRPYCDECCRRGGW